MGAACNHVFTTDYADKSQTDLKEFSEWTCKNKESRTQEWNLHFLGYLLFISCPKNSTANQTEGNEGNEESGGVESGNQEPRKFPNGGALARICPEKWRRLETRAGRTRSARSRVWLRNFPSRCEPYSSLDNGGGCSGETGGGGTKLPGLIVVMICGSWNAFATGQGVEIQSRSDGAAAIAASAISVAADGSAAVAA
jgi:hypothetical protein